eukprot:CAMPEP_0115392482 /NCGR_PEP_ID=MMETSP0271-20121206/11242_1 /TAXON_ID=71861 /ORGANISM="Scrippsiella trochoidea, Strain CCMP3099" /LENGTH=106 /DNA_ID=CAMNT_0002816061 /DNA_START=23 /DNA_END=340 /DNA_ORIENTATION=-
MVRSEKSPFIGPYDNKLRNLSHSVEALQVAGEVVVRIVDVDTAYAVAKNILRHYDTESCTACCGTCTGFCNMRLQRLYDLCVAAEKLEDAPVEQAQELLEAMLMKQ